MSASTLHPRTAWLFTVLVTVVFSDIASAIIIRPDRDDQRYRELAKTFPAVCWIPDGDPGGANHGTGTLIAPRWVLTAAHVVDGGVALNGPVATRVLIAGQSYRVRRIILYPEYQPTTFELGQCDIALIELDEPVQGVSPMPIYVKKDEINQTAHLVGFGFSGTFETGQPNGAGALYHATVPTKRAATNVISAVDGNLLTTTIDPATSATDLEGSLGTADSGGPLLIDVNGHSEVAGVAHILYGDKAKHQHFGGQDAYIRVSRFARWIERTTGEDFGAPSTTMGWILTAVAVVVVVLGLIRRRRRTRGVA